MFKYGKVETGKLFSAGWDIKNVEPKVKPQQRAVFWSKLFYMRTNSTTIFRIFQEWISVTWYKFLAYYLVLHFFVNINYKYLIMIFIDFPWYLYQHKLQVCHHDFYRISVLFLWICQTISTNLSIWNNDINCNYFEFSEDIFDTKLLKT